MKGGLGVIKLRVQNEALLLKNLHKFFNKANLPWVYLVWSQYYSNGKLPTNTSKGSSWWQFYFGKICGMVQFYNTHILSSSLLLKMKTFQCSQSDNMDLWRSLFTFHYLRKLLSNSVSSKYWFSHWILIITVILGHISGGLGIFHQINVIIT
jgi:hypothetical protein